jgi:hypothetical protein
LGLLHQVSIRAFTHVIEYVQSSGAFVRRMLKNNCYKRNRASSVKLVSAITGGL